MTRIISACLGILLAMSAAFSVGATAIAQPPVKDPEGVLLGQCIAAGRTSQASATRVGEALVTAYHWAGGEVCSKVIKGASHFPKHDISILQAGNPGECRDAKPGEPLTYIGYPGTRYGVVLMDEDVVLEGDTGVLYIPDTNTRMQGASGPPTMLQHISVGSSSRVRGGYSGGAVLSGIDGRVVGIINGVWVGQATVFTPISTVCKLIKEVQYEQSSIHARP